VSVAESLARVMNRVYDRMRHADAFKLRPEDAKEASFESLRGHNYAVMVTFRRNGEAVPSPVWFGLDDEGRAFARTMHDAGKVKRIRNDPRALIAPSTFRGKPKGAVLAGTARVLPKEEWPHAEAALAAAYGASRKIYEGVFGGPEDMGTYIEISPHSRGGSGI
jgi:PPOX class probable F420-dependent enzyme